MLDPVELETLYKEYAGKLQKSAPDTLIDINLHTLDSLHLLDIYLLDESLLFPQTQDHFYMVETDEKLTLFNQDFIVWIVPHMQGDASHTYGIIAMNHSIKPHLELIFSASGVYNTSRIVLSVLNAFLKEIKENEETLAKIAK